MSKLTSLITIAMLSCVLDASARAESPVRQCSGWWRPTTTVATSLQGLEVRPWIRVPALWDSQDGSIALPSVDDLGPGKLTVEVEGAGPVAGTLTLRTFDAPLFELGKTAWWRPDVDLSPGVSYRMSVQVSPRAAGQEGQDCDYRAFTSELSFTVTDGLVMPTLAVEVVSRDAEVVDPRDYFVCDERQGEVQCPLYPRVCCQPPNEYRELRVNATVSGLIGERETYVVTVTFERPGAPTRRMALYPGYDSVHAADLWVAPYGPPEADTECAVVELEGMAFGEDGRVVATARRCADPALHEAFQVEEFECNQGICRLIDEGFEFVADPDGVEAAEAVAEVDTTDSDTPGGDASGQDTTPVDSSPHESAPGGCGAAATAVPWGVSMGLLMMLGWRRRRLDGVAVGARRA